MLKNSVGLYQKDIKNSVKKAYMHQQLDYLLTVRMFLVIQNKWKIAQLDVQTTFLNGEIDNDIYIKASKGVFVKREEPYRECCD